MNAEEREKRDFIGLRANNLKNIITHQDEEIASLTALLESSKVREKGLREILKELLEDQDKEWKFERWPGLESSEWANPDAWKKHKEVCEKAQQALSEGKEGGV